MTRSPSHKSWIVARLVAATGLLAVAGGGGLWAWRSLLPPEGATARGLRVGGLEIGEGKRPRDAAEDAARRLLGRRVKLRYEGEALFEASLAELGAEVDVARLGAEIATVGHERDLFDRLDGALEARRGRIDLAVHLALPADALTKRIEAFKEEHDSPPIAAKINLATGIPTPHVPGRYFDAYAAVAAIDAAIAEDSADVDVAPFTIAPLASTEAALRIDTSAIVSKYETHFGYVGGQANRAQNVARAASLMDGVVLMPGEIVSFNANVGPRSIENGFATAPEIYKGELREGVGGGTCQVAGTLHAAAFFGGMDIVNRMSHSRPSGYIPMGLDATVVYPVVDLRLRNPYGFPIVIHSVVDNGTLRFELRGSVRPATVELATDTIGVAPFKRKIEETAWMPAGQFKLKQKGIRGYSIKKTRRIHLRDGHERIEVTTDVYPPTFEIYMVPPGTDVATALPPPPPEAT